jgi:hypothetical protein
MASLSTSSPLPLGERTIYCRPGTDKRCNEHPVK